MVGAHHKRPAPPLEPPSDWNSLKDQLLQFFAVISVAAVVAFLGITIVEWQKRQSLPFCNTYHSDADGSCIPCPPDGKCWDGQLECSPGFIRLGKSCMRDHQAGRAVHLIADFIVQQVCGKYSLLLCNWTGPAWLTESEVTQLVEQSGLDRRLGLDAMKFKLANEEAMNEVKDKLITKSNLQGVQELHCPSEMVENYKPFWCRTRERLINNYVSLLISIPLVCEALEEKATQKKLGGETWVVASHLRDHLLSPRERKNNASWLMVEQMIQKDSRIDQYPKLIKGESKVVWEWQVEGPLRSPSLKR